jgi:LmbE family N-acetylglucosaminyl deacetylase
MKALVVAAHPDDEVLGAGGTIARMAQQGHDVAIAILGEGLTSRYLEGKQTDPKLLVELRTRSENAIRALGVTSFKHYDLPDNRFDTVPLLDIVKIIEDLIKHHAPSAVYTHHGGDVNIDHALTFRAVLTATRPMEGGPVKEIFSFEVPSSTEWAFQKLFPPFQPDTFFDIAETLDQKIASLAWYEPEMRLFPHPRSSEVIRAMAARWGSCVGLKAAEAFELVRSIR